MSPWKIPVVPPRVFACVQAHNNTDTVSLLYFTSKDTKQCLKEKYFNFEIILLVCEGIQCSLADVDLSRDASRFKVVGYCHIWRKEIMSIVYCHLQKKQFIMAGYLNIWRKKSNTVVCCQIRRKYSNIVCSLDENAMLDRRTAQYNTQQVVVNLISSPRKLIFHVGGMQTKILICSQSVFQKLWEFRLKF